MTQVYDILDAIKDKLLANPSVFTVKFGDLDEIDLNKTDIYPLAHLDLAPNVTFVDNTRSYSVYSTDDHSVTLKSENSVFIEIQLENVPEVSCFETGAIWLIDYMP